MKIKIDFPQEPKKVEPSLPFGLDVRECPFNLPDHVLGFILQPDTKWINGVPDMSEAILLVK
jgi:hypothetical protein